MVGPIRRHLPQPPPVASHKYRVVFYSTEQRSYPASQEGATRLHLTIDTAHAAQPAPSCPASNASSFAEHDPSGEA
ncbi:hypothetical protein E4K10_04270 [Streptomyces sp. T1317-0309]|nr:hypothetical protein E4K10_04270 [Streptomyces sp. T1317-0309]